MSVTASPPDLCENLEMVRIQDWAVTSTQVEFGDHSFEHLVASAETTDVGIAWAAGALPSHYAESGRIASILADLGKSKAAEYLASKLPTSKKARSGDLGEIIGAAYVERELGYGVIARFRWKDHREMAMRGDDVIGFRIAESGSVEFLKGEVKSRASLKTKTVTEADEALQRDNGLPSPHTLAFVADRLFEQDQNALASLIDKALLSDRIAQGQVEQLLFTFTGNNPCNILRGNTEAYEGEIRRRAVGLQVPEHQAFIEAVYVKVIDNA
jgi:hypothetical protein